MARSRKRRRFHAAAALAVAMLAAPTTLAVDTPALAAASASTPSCAWRLETTPSTANVALPDSDAVYWTTPFTVEDGLKITVAGSYADARYTSLTVYSSNRAPFTTNGVSSGLPDFLTAPDAGSVNPWQQTAAPGGNFTVTLTQDVVAGESNTLPLAPAETTSGATGYLIYRVYLPAGGNAADVHLPTLTFTQDDVSNTPPVCGASTAADSGPDMVASQPTVTASAASPQFARGASGTGGLFPNLDNAYLSASVTPPADGSVLVVHGKAPRTPTGDDPAPWPAADADIRYWSLCDNLAKPPLPVVVNTLPDGSIDYGCRADDATSLDSSGYYTFAVGTEAQRSAIDSIPGVTFVPLSSASPTSQHLLLFRNLLGAEFAESVQNVPSDDRAATAAVVMKAYYPRTTWCSVTILAAGGAAACFGS
ncbi:MULTISPECIES: hypothetical protein [unclassified Frankia]|uniref:hypothetical protein n=1 Tax=unclassified Frankia TaxID=2632575 RepID=UPI001EF6DE9E|nr:MULTISPECIES: hypothetical protein [unclassified Frankia]